MSRIKLIDTFETAKLLNVCVGKLANDRSSGSGIDLKFTKVGGKIGYNKYEVEEYIRANTFNHTGEVKLARAQCRTLHK